MYSPLPNEILCHLSVWGEVKKYTCIHRNAKKKEQPLRYKTVPVPIYCHQSLLQRMFNSFVTPPLILHH